MSVTHEEITDAFNDLHEAYNGKITVDHSPLNQPKDIYHDRITEEENKQISASYHPARGVILIFVANLHNDTEIFRAISHEIGGHWSLNTLEPIEKRNLLENIVKSRVEPSLSEKWAGVECSGQPISDTPLGCLVAISCS